MKEFLTAWYKKYGLEYTHDKWIDAWDLMDAYAAGYLEFDHDEGYRISDKGVEFANALSA